jgi:hypothetical protein
MWKRFQMPDNTPGVKRAGALFSCGYMVALKGKGDIGDQINKKAWRTGR